MMWNYFLCVILLTASVLSKPQQQTQTISNNNGVSIQQEIGPNKPVKDGTPYQVTENTPDRPDDRTLAPIDPTYGINVPLNLANNTNIIVNNGYPVTDVPENHDKDTTDKIKLKKNSFSYVQIQGEFDDQVQIPNFLPNFNSQVDTQQNNIGFKRFLDGIRSYIFSMKKGLVDGLHNWYNKQSINTNQFRTEIDKFYRSFHEDSNPDFEGSGEIENWLNREDIQKEILDIYKSLNEESSEDVGGGDHEDSGDEYEDYGDDYGHHSHSHHHHHHKGHDC